VAKTGSASLEVPGTLVIRDHGCPSLCMKWGLKVPGRQDRDRTGSEVQSFVQNHGSQFFSSDWRGFVWGSWKETLAALKSAVLGWKCS